MIDVKAEPPCCVACRFFDPYPTRYLGECRFAEVFDTHPDAHCTEFKLADRLKGKVLFDPNE